MSVIVRHPSVWLAGCRCGSTVGAVDSCANWHDPRSQRPHACLPGELPPTSLVRKPRWVHCSVDRHTHPNRLGPYRDAPPHNTPRLAAFPAVLVCVAPIVAVAVSPPRREVVVGQSAKTSIHLARTRAMLVEWRTGSLTNHVAFFHSICRVGAVDVLFGTLPIHPNFTQGSAHGVGTDLPAR
jgi:hypothetical protein